MTVQSCYSVSGWLFTESPPSHHQWKETWAVWHHQCAVVILIDNIHIVSDWGEVIWSLFSFTAELWRLVDVRSDGGPGLDDMKVGQLDSGHWGIFSYGFRSLLQWVIMQCWSVAGAGLPSSHMRGCAFSCGHTACRERRRKVSAANNQNSFVAVLTALHKH